MIKEGQIWSLGDDHRGETIAYVVELVNRETIKVIVLTSSIKGCQPGTTEMFSTSWFRENGSLLP